MKILWVEDQIEDNRGILSIFEKHGSKVRFAATVQETMGLIRSSGTFDIAIVDLNIPLGEGVDVNRLADSKYNGRYVIEKLLDEAGMAHRVICLTNFFENARADFGGLVEVVPKISFLSEIERIIYGG